MVNFKRNQFDRFNQSQERSETLALKSLIYLAANQSDCERFFAESGLGPDDLKARAGEPDFLAGVLDFFLSDETLLVRFANSENMQPESVARARRGLPGGLGDAEH